MVVVLVVVGVVVLLSMGGLVVVVFSIGGLVVGEVTVNEVIHFSKFCS